MFEAAGGAAPHSAGGPRAVQAAVRAATHIGFNSQSLAGKAPKGSCKGRQASSLLARSCVAFGQAGTARVIIQAGSNSPMLSAEHLSPHAAL